MSAKRTVEYNQTNLYVVQVVSLVVCMRFHRRRLPAEIQLEWIFG